MKQTKCCGAAREVRTGRAGTEGGQRLSSLLKTRCNHVIKDDMKMQTHKGSKCNPNCTEFGLSILNHVRWDEDGNNDFVNKASRRSGLLLVHFSPVCPTAPEEVSQSGNEIKAAHSRMSFIHTCRVTVRCRCGSCSQPASPARGRDHLPCPISCGQTMGNGLYILY